jgi:hypothetical protein
MSGWFAESTFWYYVGHRVWDDVAAQIEESLGPLDSEAKKAGFPLEWDRGLAVPWATICRVYLLSKEHVPDLGPREFEALRRGVSASISPRGFFEHALKRILGNVEQPALPGRQLVDSLADTFALASIRYLVADLDAELLHPRVLEWVVTDYLVHQAALLAIASERDFWAACEGEYRRRRPGWFRRTFSNADTWLFER